jgi:hypothetical protein
LKKGNRQRPGPVCQNGYRRLSLGFSKKLESLEAAIALFICYYNFCWRPDKMRITPAMAARVTDRFWTFADLMAELERI